MDLFETHTPKITPPSLDDLNPEQRTAVEHLDGPILVLAGAGSGKTRVLTVRIARLVLEHGVPPERILSVTFTNKAAGEMRARIRGFLGQDPRGMWLGTFHSLGARMLRRHAEVLGWDPAFTIFDAEQSLREIKRIMEPMGLDPKRWKPQAIRGAISEAKNQLVTASAFQAQHAEGFDFFVRIVAQVYPTYQKALRDQNAFDFDDLLVKPVELLEGDPLLLERYQARFAFVLVDEYQDTNRAQFRFLELLASKHRNLMVVGDDDQSIYGWRGADIRNILDFEATYPGAAVVRLEQNYRSTGTILEAANAVIRRNHQRKEKTLRTEREEGPRVQVVETADERDESSWIVDEIEARRAGDGKLGYRDFSILYRTNAQSRAMEEAFRRRGVPYQIVGGVRFYERREIQDVLAYLRLISNPRDAAAFQRIVNVPRRGIGGVSERRFLDWAVGMGLTPLEAAARAGEIPELPPGARRALVAFAALIAQYAARAQSTSVGTLLEALLQELDMFTHLRAEGPEGEDRADNVRELIAGALEFDAELDEEWEGEAPDTFTELDLFLQRVALVTDLDRSDPDADTVTFMTLHNAKGLEFPHVFLAGLEEGLFPLGRSYDDPLQLEEERRLFYVGITRAEDQLSLCWARERRRAGDFMHGTQSSFIEDIPEALVERRRSPRLERDLAAYDPRAARGTWGGGASRASGGTHPPRGEGGGEGDTGTPFSPRRVSQRREAESERRRLEVEFEEGLNQDAPTFRTGERVQHPAFGGGSVLEISGPRDDLRVTVRFDRAGEKKLLLRFAKLEREW